jgi:hypothetical protein
MPATRHLYWHLRLLPCLPTVMTHVHLSTLRTAVHVRRGIAVDSDLRHAARWCVPDVNTLPALTGVTTAE